MSVKANGKIWSASYCIALVVYGGAPTCAIAANESGWGTQAQATRGHQLFNNYCAQCHGPELTGAAGPALVGPAFMGKWGNQPVHVLFTFEHNNMPATNPGSLPNETISAITAYILQKNGLPAGSTELNKSSASRVLPAK